MPEAPIVTCLFLRSSKVVTPEALEKALHDELQKLAQHGLDSKIVDDEQRLCASR